MWYQNLGEICDQWKGTPGYQPHQCVVPTVPACIASGVLTQPAPLGSYPRMSLRHISNLVSVLSGSIWSQIFTFLEISPSLPFYIFTKEKLNFCFLPGKMSFGNEIPWTTHLDFVYEFQWERKKYAGQIQVNVSKAILLCIYFKEPQNWVTSSSIYPLLYIFSVVR